MNTTSGIPTLKEHLTETWETFKASVGNLFLLSVVSLLVNAVLFTVVIGSLIGLTASTVDVPALVKDLETSGPAALSQIPPTFYTGLITTFVILTIVSTIISTIFMAAMIFAVGWADKKPKLGELIKAGFSYAGWIILFNIISFFLIFGGFWVFLVGAIVMGIFFSFGMHEMLLNNKSPWVALRSSVSLVAENFGTFIARMGFLLLAFIVVFVIVPAIMSGIHESLGELVSFVLNIVSWFINWFVLAYSIVLYKHLRAATPETETHDGLWKTLIGMSILGWVIALLMGSLVVTGIKELLKEQNLDQLTQQFQTEFQKSMSEDGIIEPSEFDMAPSTCGLSVPIPSGYSSETPPRYWMYEEELMADSAFRGLAPVAQTKDGVLGGFLAYKTNDERINEESTNFSYPGYAIYCVDNTAALDLYGFAQQALENKEYSITLEGETEKWGEIEVQPASIEGLMSGDYYKENVYLTVAPVSQKLILILPLGTEPGDAEETQINENMANIQNNMKYIDDRAITE